MTQPNIAALSLALSRAGKPPCVKFKCDLAPECAAELRACGAFLVYVRSGDAIDPRTRVTGDERINAREIGDEIIATREIYDRAMAA